MKSFNTINLTKNILSNFIEMQHYLMNDGNLVIFNVGQSGDKTSHLSYTCKLQNSVTKQTTTSQPYLLSMHFSNFSFN